MNKERARGPVIEDPNSEQVFLSEDPVELLRSGKYTKVPLMIGYTTREGILGEITMKEKYGEFRVTTNFEEAIPYFLNLPKGSGIQKKIAQRIKKFYYGKETPSLKNVDRYYIVSSKNYKQQKPFYQTIFILARLR